MKFHGGTPIHEAQMDARPHRHDRDAVLADAAQSQAWTAPEGQIDGQGRGGTCCINITLVWEIQP